MGGQVWLLSCNHHPARAALQSFCLGDCSLHFDLFAVIIAEAVLARLRHACSPC